MKKYWKKYFKHWRELNNPVVQFNTAKKFNRTNKITKKNNKFYNFINYKLIFACFLWLFKFNWVIIINLLTVKDTSYKIIDKF